MQLLKALAVLNIPPTARVCRLASLLQEAMDVRTYGQHMYFSYQQDITRTMQSSIAGTAEENNLHSTAVKANKASPASGAASVRASGKAGHPDWGYVFNRALLQPFIGEPQVKA